MRGNKFVEVFESYPNSQVAMMDLFDMLEEYKFTFYGIELSRKNFINIKKELNTRGVKL